MQKNISIIVPVRNEATRIISFLKKLQSLRQHAEIIVVDGQSKDDTAKLAEAWCDKLVASPAGRAIQMNAGAKLAQSNTLLFLHADTYLPDNAHELVEQALRENEWGRFDIKLSGEMFMFRIIKTLINLRSRLSNIATGDQAIFLKKDLFNHIGMYDQQPLMEDIALCRKLRRHGDAACIKQKAVTSSRRWEEHGVWKTIVTMWSLRFAYFIGISPSKLYRFYYSS